MCILTSLGKVRKGGEQKSIVLEASDKHCSGFFLTLQYFDIFLIFFLIYFLIGFCLCFSIYIFFHDNNGTLCA